MGEVATSEYERGRLAGKHTIDRMYADRIAQLESELAALKQVQNPMESAPRDGTEIVVWWPLLKLPEELDAVPTEFVDDADWGTFVVTKWEGRGWMDPPFCEAVGGYFGDDYEYAPDPLYWWPCPGKPQRPRPELP